MKHLLSVLSAGLLLSFASCTSRSTTEAPQRWSEEKANTWYAALPWMSGCNYTPCNAINQVEMWSAETFDPEQIEKELAFASDTLGFNTMRVFLSSVVYEHDAEGLKTRMGQFLGICKNHSIRPMFVFFDDCWTPETTWGKQPEPKTGTHNSGWLRDPANSLREDTVALYPKLKAYVSDIVTTFAADDRILLWDLYNEPGNSGYGVKSLPLVKKVFEWARACSPTQPLTVGVWNLSKDFAPLNALQLNESDVTSYHCYNDVPVMQNYITYLGRLNRPLVCTEYMARTHGSRFDNIMPLLKQNKVVAINWGFVAGKTNTMYSWEKVIESGEEPEVWFHDIVRPDFTPYDRAEIDTIRALNGKK